MNVSEHTTRGIDRIKQYTQILAELSKKKFTYYLLVITLSVFIYPAF
jgi:hypothetical protein